MNTKRKLPYFTEEDLNAQVPAVTIRVFGSYTKRGDQRKEVYEEQYDAELCVPKDWNMGHVKLAANRYVKDELKGIRSRTYNVDTSERPKAFEGTKRRRDFMSHQGMMDNTSLKREYDQQQAARQARRDAEENGDDPMPGRFSDDTEYGRDGLPKFSDRTYITQ